MNLLEIYVSNITYVSPPDPEGARILIADTDCYGRTERGKKMVVSEDNYKSILEKGYYLG